MATVIAVAVVTFPDEDMYLATKEWRETHPAMIPWPDSLDLHGKDLIDDAKLKQIIEKNERSVDQPRWVATLDLKGRDLTRANLKDADVRHADFSGAILNRAHLDGAWAAEAHFDGASLEGATLEIAQLEGAKLWGVHLQSALAFGAQFQGASLLGAQLRGAELNLAQFQGGTLVGAQLQGTSLFGAQLQGATLTAAQFQGATLEVAQLQGASLERVQLQGASLERAQLQGATLERAQLQGATFKSAQLRGAAFTGAFVWRADARKAEWKDTRVERIETGAKLLCGVETSYPTPCIWTTDTFENLKKLITEQVTNITFRKYALQRIKRSLDPKQLGGEEKIAEVWTDHESESPGPAAYAQIRAEEWRKTGCAAAGAPHVVRAFLSRLDSWGSPFYDDSPERPDLADAFLDPNCAGARGLSDEEIAKLKTIAKSAAQTTLGGSTCAAAGGCPK